MHKYKQNTHYLHIKMTKSKFFAIFLDKMFANSNFLCNFAVANKK